MFGNGGSEGTESGGRSDVVSVVGPGMAVDGDCRCEGSLRVEGRVEGTIRAGKSVVVGDDGEVVGDVFTQDAVVAGRVVGAIRAESRAELKEGCRVEGDISSPSVRLEEGGSVDGELSMSGEDGGGAAGDGKPTGVETAGAAGGASAADGRRGASGRAEDKVTK